MCNRRGSASGNGAAVRLAGFVVWPDRGSVAKLSPRFGLLTSLSCPDLSSSRAWVCLRHGSCAVGMRGPWSVVWIPAQVGLDVLRLKRGMNPFSW